jgi:alkyl sulfatase BDS1-like metallo-beta-lactamase superfamily hydrolase
MPTNRKTLLLQADIFEQMGYQAKSARWRNTYLSVACELRNGVSKDAASTQAGPDMIKAMSSEMLFNLLGIKLDITKAQTVNRENRENLDQMLMKTMTFKQLIANNQIAFDGDAKVFFGLMQMMEEFPFWFNVATP